MMNNTIEIPHEYMEPLFQRAAETGLSVEEIVESAIKKLLERRMTDNA
ncbi:MAG: ribbon-helix-helix protein, CopG family [Ruminococcus sp.]|nr:ribbon-helix-helix protein, CopG family [Ruminococcus sp.]MBQ3285777.1 ribbon-helix-helix protein, CopG family [Ruminococcus sp.]